MDMTVTLRALEPEDMELLYKWENDSSLWSASDTITPLSRFNLREYIQTSHIDIHVTRQLKLVAECGGEPVGMADLFDFDPHNGRVSVGILVYEESMRNRGIGTKILEQIVNYAFNVLCVHQIAASVAVGNSASIALFRKAGFESCGLKKDWLRRSGHWVDVIEYQLIRKD